MSMKNRPWRVGRADEVERAGRFTLAEEETRESAIATGARFVGRGGRFYIVKTPEWRSPGPYRISTHRQVFRVISKGKAVAA